MHQSFTSSKISRVMILVPIREEPPQKITAFCGQLDWLKRLMRRERGVELEYFLLCEGSPHLAQEDRRVPVKHERSLGHASTLLEGYETVVRRDPKPDVVVRLDVGINPRKVIEIVEDLNLQRDAQILCAPAIYSHDPVTQREVDVLRREVYQLAIERHPLQNWDRMGYGRWLHLNLQAFRAEFLAEVFPRLKNIVRTCERESPGSGLWGIDLSVLLLASFQVDWDRIVYRLGHWFKRESYPHPDDLHKRHLKAVFEAFKQHTSVSRA